MPAASICAAPFTVPTSRCGHPHQAPQVNHEKLAATCEIPSVIASCPTGAIRRHLDKNINSVEVRDERCMYCGNCYTVCPSMPLSDPKETVWPFLSAGKFPTHENHRCFRDLRYLFSRTTRPAGRSNDILKRSSRFTAETPGNTEAGRVDPAHRLERFFSLTNIPVYRTAYRRFHLRTEPFRATTQFKW